MSSADMSLINSLPLGFRFRPTDQELIDFYLRNKITGHHHHVKVIREIDVCKWEPWDLPGLSEISSDDGEWFFFAGRDQKFPNSKRLNRATNRGYWKATGKDRKVKNRSGEQIGIKKSLVFYTGRAPKGKRTNWVMHEYQTTVKELLDQSVFVLCRLFKKNDVSVQDSVDDEIENVTTAPPTSVLSNLNVKSENEVNMPAASGQQSNNDETRSTVSSTLLLHPQVDEWDLLNETDDKSNHPQFYLAPEGSYDSCHYMDNNKRRFPIDHEMSLEQVYPELGGNCWTDDDNMVSELPISTGSCLLNNDDLEHDIMNFYNGTLDFGDEMFKQFGSSGEDEPVGHTETGISLRVREETNQLVANDVPKQGNAVRRLLLQQKVGPVYHCNHVVSHQTEAKSMQGEIHSTNAKLTSSRVESRKWSFMFASDGKTKTRPEEEYHTCVSKSSCTLASKKLKIWTAFAAVLFAVFIGLPVVKFLGRTQMLLD